MKNDWRLSSFNGALLASYFIPAWTIAAFKIWSSPVRGLYDRANIAPAMFISDYLHLTATPTIRFAWLLALGKLTVVAFFVVFMLLIVRQSIRKEGSCDEALSFALLFGVLISMLSMLAASQVGELDALRMHATESLLLIGGAIILIIDSAPAAAKAMVHRSTASEQQVYPFGTTRP